MSLSSKVVLLLAAFLPFISTAQNAEPATRVGQIEAEQRSRAEHLKPDAPDRAEQGFIKVENLIDRFFGSTGGFSPIIGNMVVGSGFAAGVEYFRPDLAKGKLLFRGSARASVWKYEALNAELSLPHLASDWVYLTFSGGYRNYPSLSYYGPGPDSSKNGRSNYRLEQANGDVTLGFRPRRHFSFGATAGYLTTNVGPGTSSRFVSADKIYNETQAPGIQFQTDHLRGGPWIQYDYRDRPDDPHSGGNYRASYIYYDDLTLNTGDHRKLNVEAQQYFPFFNKKRVIAFRAKTELSYRNADQVVPFYLQPELGGSEDLRGFRPFRFYDNNLLVMNAEYRWEIMSGFDMALFGDTGKVFHRHAQLNLADLETCGGFGLRFKSRDAVFMRWDVGFSREGFQVWIKFNNVF